MLDLDDFCDPEQAEWFRMTPQERLTESAKLWEIYLGLGGSLDPEYDPQCPFYDEQEWRELFAHGGPGMHLIRRSGV